MIYFAPLHGITDQIFRREFASRFNGVHSFYAPFITTVDAEIVAKSHLADIASRTDLLKNHQVVPQILGKNPKSVATLAVAMEKMGYTEINWNLGCPYTKITRKQRGSGLLPHPEIIAQVLDYTIPRLATSRFSIKARLGLHDPDELRRLFDVLNQYPLLLVIIHPRIADQGYSGHTDLDRFEQCVLASKHHIIYNGDIRSVEDYRMLEKRFNSRIQGYMLGRGLVSNPFLAEIITSQTLIGPSTMTRFRDFHDALLAEYHALPASHCSILGRMKELWSYWHKFIPVSMETLHGIRTTKTLQQYEIQIRKIDALK